MIKLKKLNNKGLTVIEMLVCFILVVIITTSMYTMVNAYKNKQEIEATKEKIVTYKNLLTKEINDDLIKRGVVSVDIDPYDSTSTEYNVVMYMRDGTKGCLKIQKKASCNSFMNNSDYMNSSNVSTGINCIKDESLRTDPSDIVDTDEEFYVAYRNVNAAVSCANPTKYKLPDLGASTNVDGKTIYDFRINNVEIKNENSVLSIYIGFYHPEVLTRYAIDIVCPINF